MSIFGKIKTAIFGETGKPLGGQFSGGSKPAPAPAAPAPRAAAPAAPKPAAAPAPAPAAAAPKPAAAPVDVAAVLGTRAAQHGGDLNWKTSIVDLMKLLDLDSSLTARKELAEELGYTGAKDGSAEMNIWLHKAVMKKLAENGGTVPAELRD